MKMSTRDIAKRGVFRRRLLTELLEPRLVLDSTVVINEVMYHPVTNEEGLEWIELYNQLSVDMDISRWRLEGGIDYEFAEGTIVGGGQYKVVAIDPAALNAGIWCCRCPGTVFRTACQQRGTGAVGQQQRSYHERSGLQRFWALARWT